MRSPSYMLRNGPFFPRTLETQFGTKRLFSGRSKSLHGAVYYAALCLPGRRYCP